MEPVQAVEVRRLGLFTVGDAGFQPRLQSAQHFEPNVLDRLDDPNWPFVADGPQRHDAACRRVRDSGKLSVAASKSFSTLAQARDRRLRRAATTTLCRSRSRTFPPNEKAPGLSGQGLFYECWLRGPIPALLFGPKMQASNISAVFERAVRRCY
jgi:hypothetical protein